MKRFFLGRAVRLGLDVCGCESVTVQECAENVVWGVDVTKKAMGGVAATLTLQIRQDSMCAASAKDWTNEHKAVARQRFYCCPC